MNRLRKWRQRITLAFLLIFEADDRMLVVVYVTLVIAGRRTFEAVPANLKPGVEAELAAMGVGTDGKPLEGAASGNSMVQNITINSPKAMTPAEVEEAIKKASRNI